MQILITGADGFAGQHLIRALNSADSTDQLHGTTYRDLASPPPNVTYHTLDLRDEFAVAQLIGELRPQQIYHLAALANVGQSYEVVWNTLENNIRAQLNLILACVQHNLKPRLLIVSSGDIYGDRMGDQPAREDTPFRPNNPYSVSKVTQDMLALQYYLSNDLPILRARPFNHLGPGQKRGFVAPDFAYQIAQIEAGSQEPVMKVGSLSAERDFSDVRDVVRAYALIMARGTPGEAYNIASGVTRPVQKLLDTLLAFSDAKVAVKTETGLLRPNSFSRTWGDAAKLRAETGWQPTITFEQTLHDVLDDYRQRVQVRAQE